MPSQRRLPSCPRLSRSVRPPSNSVTPASERAPGLQLPIRDQLLRPDPAIAVGTGAGIERSVPSDVHHAHGVIVENSSTSASALMRERAGTAIAVGEPVDDRARASSLSMTTRRCCGRCEGALAGRTRAHGRLVAVGLQGGRYAARCDPARPADAAERRRVPVSSTR